MKNVKNYQKEYSLKENRKMDKKKLIKIYEAKLAEIDRRPADFYNIEVNRVVKEALELAKQLDESEPAKVPQWFANWIEEQLKGGLTKGKVVGELWYNYHASKYDSCFTQSEEDWIGENDELATRAILDGCEVEEELYYVKIPYKVWDDEAAELKTEFYYLGYDMSSDETRLFTTKGEKKVLGSIFRTKLSKTTIESADPRYLEFLEEVEK